MVVENSRVFPVDMDHQGIRLALPALMVVGLIGGYFLSSWLLNLINPDLALGCFPVIGGVIVALGISALGDRVLKRLWPSGRTVTLDETGFEVHDNRRNKPPTVRVNWSQRVNIQTWRFTVKRGSARVPKGWLMLGLQALQDDALVTVYTFAPEKEIQDNPNFKLFMPLAPKAQLESNDFPLREKIEQRRLHKAEEERWQDGAELRRQDFLQLVEVVRQRVPDWQKQA